MAETELERLERQYTQAKNRLQAAKARQSVKQRKLDARRKIILGGALLDLSARDPDAMAMVERLLRSLPRDQDRKAFDAWRDTSPARTADGQESVSSAAPTESKNNA